MQALPAAFLIAKSRTTALRTAWRMEFAILGPQQLQYVHV